MSHVFRATPGTGGERRCWPRVAAIVVLLAFGQIALAHSSDATETGPLPSATSTDGKTVDVIISNFTFTPSELTIAPGTTVRWVNQDDIPHLVAEKTLAFKSKALDTDDSFSFTFNKPSDVTYFCVLHPHMVGKIIVKVGGA